MSNPNPAASQTAASEIMLAFANRTGLSSDRPVRRYLWTDAFAVCNFLTLYQATRDEAFKKLALALIDQVHETLGRFRPDDPRKGWISGLSEEEGRKHPTAGGLRIGKPLPERAPDAAFDAQLEWDRDGQYYHYLTKWMHALMQAGCTLDAPELVRWALELALVANRAFVWQAPDQSMRMHWKMRTDLGQPLVASMGQHDPLDGLVTCLSLVRAVQKCTPDSPLEELHGNIRTLAQITGSQSLETDDPLGLGGLLFDAGRLLQLPPDCTDLPGGLINRLLRSAIVGTDLFLQKRGLNLAVGQRLAFRELGLAIGLEIADTLPLDRLQISDSTLRQIQSLSHYQPVRTHILKTWLIAANQKQDSWQAHMDINSVMLATCLAPAGFLVLASPIGKALKNEHHKQ